MRWKFVFGFGIAGAVAGSALGQFAVDRTPQIQPGSGIPAAAPQQPVNSIVPAGFQPVTPTTLGGAYTPPVGGLPTAGARPATNQFLSPDLPVRPITAPPRIEIESALGPNHEWALKPEHGPYFILVKSYSRPHTPTPEDQGLSARALGEMLAGDIRQLYKVQAFLYEYISEERKAEAAALAAERERGRQFVDQMENRKKQSELQGMGFMDPDNRIRFKTVNYRDQIAVMVGGFKSEEDAKKALLVMRTWKPPEQKILMDAAVVSNLSTDGKNARIENGRLNPYLSATVVSNPLIPRQIQEGPSHADPFIVKLNEGCPYNLFKATKAWTLAVKSFNAPVQLVGKDADQNVMAKSGSSKGGNALLAGAAQAEAMAKMLREMKDGKGQPLRLEAFVLHTRHSSIVTVGQFDSPNDPALLQTENLLMSMKLKMSEDQMGIKLVGNGPGLFDAKLLPILIPKS
jgi:hypothetical protein